METPSTDKSWEGHPQPMGHVLWPHLWRGITTNPLTDGVSLVWDLNSNFKTKELESVSTGVEGDRLLPATVTSSSSPVADGAVSCVPLGGRRDMSMSKGHVNVQGTCQCSWLELLRWRTCCCVCMSLVFVVLLLELLSHSTDQVAVGTILRKLYLSICS
jgi:hypothetical protein